MFVPQLIQEFYKKTFYERSGGDWSHVEAYEAYRAIVSKLDSSVQTNYSVLLSGHGDLSLPSDKTDLSPEAFGVDGSKLLEKWQLEILWSSTVALFVFFGMIGAIISAKVADYFGRWVQALCGFWFVNYFIYIELCESNWYFNCGNLAAKWEGIVLFNFLVVLWTAQVM